MTEHQRQPSTPRPHLIHVGYAKSGSSLLRHWFAEHPQMGYRHHRLAGVLWLPELADAAAGMRLRVTSSETFASPTLSGETREPGAYFAAQTNVCENLAELFPAAHILIVTRGFRSMIMSSYSQYVRSGGTDSLEELVASARRENPWDYDALIGLYRHRFGREKVMVLPWELLRDDAAAFVRQIEDRFGLDHRPPPVQRVNSSLSPIEMRWYPRFSAAVRRAPIGSNLRERLTKRVVRLSHKNRLSRLVRLLQRLAPAAPVDVEMLPPANVEAFRGKAGCLAAEPLFAPYAADYLNDAPA